MENLEGKLIKASEEMLKKLRENNIIISDLDEIEKFKLFKSTYWTVSDNNLISIEPDDSHTDFFDLGLRINILDDNEFDILDGFDLFLRKRFIPDRTKSNKENILEFLKITYSFEEFGPNSLILKSYNRNTFVYLTDETVTVIKDPVNFTFSTEIKRININNLNYENLFSFCSFVYCF